MKKTKLLTSIAALALVLGLGACEENVDVGGVDINGDETSSETGSEEETTTESTTEDNSPSESTSEGDGGSEQSPRTSIDEFTFIVTLYVDGNADSVPNYGTLYYKGGLNGGPDEDFEDFWNDGDYVALTETTNSKGEVAYTTTFKDVQIREDYDFSLLFYYSDETVGSSYSSHVVASYISSPLPETGDTGEYEVTLNTSLTEKFPDPNATTEFTGDPVADLLADVKENNNYSLTIEYSDFSSSTSYSSKDAIYDAYYNGTLSGSGYTFYVGLTYTKDVFLLEYYSENDWLNGTPNDIEAYVNNGSNLDVYYISTSYDASTLFKYETKNGYSWQTYWGSLLGLVDSADLFVVDTSSYDGSSVDYTANIDSLDVLNAIVDSLFTCGNYYSYSEYCYNYAQFIYYYKTFWNTYGAPIVESTYDLTSNEWDFGLVYLDITESKVNETTNEYRAHYYGATAYISDVGTAQIPDAYSSYLQ